MVPHPSPNTPGRHPLADSTPPHTCAELGDLFLGQVLDEPFGDDHRGPVGRDAGEPCGVGDRGGDLVVTGARLAKLRDFSLFAASEMASMQERWKQAQSE